MSGQEKMTVGSETISPETAPSVQQTCGGTLTRAGETYASRTDAQPISGALGIVERLRGAPIDWKRNGKHDIGFIAEDGAEVLLQAIAYDGRENEAKVIDCSHLVALLIEAVKEQQGQIKNQEHSLKEQRSQIAKLRAEIERIKISVRATAVR
jgi:hypothetical protein